ncbi:hypothetical protein GWK47_034861 [Chionoecetes opilio]|uniref:Tesmin/TSO1-like CXC domain-containing protein n=1 Tax=Chionoecetes opilio TaxID=41210 RepID=A0A8J4YHD4_CHIOP|nr:hypothetical protein GWK47_034861 [Chionoecetes opilio]
MDKTYRMLSTNLGAHGKCLLNSLRSYRKSLPHVLPSTHTTEVNKLRYELFCARLERWSQVNSLLVRTASSWGCTTCNYQAAIWRRRSAEPAICCNPTDCGWMTDEDGNLLSTGSRLTSTKAVMQLLSCKCVRSCELPKCTFLSKGLKCTDMCRLQTCQNKAIEEEPGSTTSRFRGLT